MPQGLARNVAQGLRILGEAQLTAKSRGMLVEYCPGTSFRHLEAPARPYFSGRAGLGNMEPRRDMKRRHC